MGVFPRQDGSDQFGGLTLAAADELKAGFNDNRNIIQLAQDNQFLRETTTQYHAGFN